MPASTLSERRDRPATATGARDSSYARLRATPRRLLQHPSAALITILICQLMVVLDATIVNVALPDIQHALGFTPTNLSWVVNAYTLTFGGLLLLGARMGDILGRRRVLIAGVVLFTVASLAGGVAGNGPLLLAARAVQGIGGALASPSALALLMTAFPAGRERLRAVGLYTAVSVGGAALGLIAGGVLVEWLSWRWVFFVNLPIGIALVVLARIVLPETPRQRGRFDVTGALTSTAGMVALVFGFVHAASDGWADPTTLASFVVGVVLLTAFVATELRAPSPITPLRLFTDRTRAGSYLARLLLVAGMFGMFFFLTQFLQDVLGYSPLLTGLAFLPLPVTVFTASQLAARVLIEKFGGRRLMIGGVALSTTALLSLTQLSESSSYLQLLAGLLLFGLGNGLAFVPLTAASLEGVEPRDAGAASGLVNVMQQVGGSLGLAVLVTVFGAAQRHAPRVSGSDALAQAHSTFVYGADRAFAVAAAMLALSLLLIVFAMRPSRPAAGDETQLSDAGRLGDDIQPDLEPAAS
ncbi:MAG: MFS transporter [bacterium]